MSRSVKAICANPLFSCKILEGAVSYMSAGANMIFKLHKKIKKTAFLALFACFSIVYIGSAKAAVAPSPCDPLYYDSLKSRAWLEAQREITQNQNLIFKPDSVLEYTCFDRYMNVLAANAPNMLSETNRWGGPVPTNMPVALTNLVGQALNSYIAANFAHTFLGGRIPANYTPAGSVTRNANYVCNNMQLVWQQMKCMDFVQNPATDGFYTFQNYRTTPDKRLLPAACNNPGLPARWQTEINLATVNNNTPWGEDNVVTFFNLLDPANCGGATLQIPTGVTVKRSKQAPLVYNEKVCIAPGCNYTPTGMNNGTCSPNP